jgi:hypothetical protein
MVIDINCLHNRGINSDIGNTRSTIICDQYVALGVSDESMFQCRQENFTYRMQIAMGDIKRVQAG